MVYPFLPRWITAKRGPYAFTLRFTPTIVAQGMPAIIGITGAIHQNIIKFSTCRTGA